MDRSPQQPSADGDPHEQTNHMFVHRRALEGIQRFRSEDLVGRHPLYLVGIEVPEHRGGPAVAALLALADGRLLGARSARVRPSRPLTETFPFDIEYLDAEGLRRYTLDWNTVLGGFPAAVTGSVNDNDAARRILTCDSSTAITLGQNTLLDLKQRKQLALPWDSSATAASTIAGVVCSVTGFTPSIDDVEPLQVSGQMKRSMLLPPSYCDEPWNDDQADLRIMRLLEEASANAIASPRSTVALLRTVAEIVVDQLVNDHRIDSSRSGSLFTRITDVETAWNEDLSERPSPADRRKLAWRSRVVASLDTVREAGNAIHFNHEVTVADAQRSVAVIVDLLATLRRDRPIEVDPEW